ncbi:MAG TPA: Asp-tRNA(Asn)/Glu-tRNA(Gln) amidotransferase subunit GatC [candidate division WOR-3 bacterium]|uniref:Aspartyl/glutamyl-tRNA(Asn/Gln) amidotransferase subunit C n=1 Tax=candidate division WOR-3 bacterium TaxID=2052148 RepID=A0A7V0Q7B6_UNCW3|nr:Asp-tRNA(Asn)/Glu-tRNA(Gln) amidotransferase subunit GatC [candidate division WOR-3 bacterium]
MEIDVKKIMKLAKLKFDENEELQIKKHFQKMLKLVEKLKSIDVTGVDPLYYPHDRTYLRRRKDKQGKGLERYEVLENAPDTFTDYIKAPSPLKGIKKK